MNIVNWMVVQKLAQNEIQAKHIANGLRLYELHDDEARKARVILYRKWRPKTDPKNQLKTKEAYDLAISGIDPADVIERQIDFLDPDRPLEDDEFNGWREDPG